MKTSKFGLADKEEIRLREYSWERLCKYFTQCHNMNLLALQAFILFAWWLEAISMQMVLIDCIEPRVRIQSTFNKCYSDRSVDFFTCFELLVMDSWLWILLVSEWVSTVLSVACRRNMLGIWPMKLSSVKVSPFGGHKHPKMGLSFKWSDLAQWQGNLISNLFPSHSSWNLQKLDSKLHAWLCYIPHENANILRDMLTIWSLEVHICSSSCFSELLGYDILAVRFYQFKSSAKKKKCIK